MNVLLVALGGSIGAVARYGLAGLVQRFTTPYFPFGTFVVNVSGCFVFGILAGVAEHRFALGPQARAFLLIGILGGFTTFSSFTYETFQLLRDAEIVRASLNAGGQLVVGLFAMWLGFVLARLP
jgi:fluoride exporter